MESFVFQDINITISSNFLKILLKIGSAPETSFEVW